MITFVLAAAVLVSALFVATAFDDAMAARPPGLVAAQVLAASLLATDHTAPVDPGDRRREPVMFKAGQTRALIVCEAELASG